MSETELSVICKSCGSEVSPYVTECPYCGARLRKRAPKLQLREDGFEAQPPRERQSRLRRLRERLRRGRPSAYFEETRPYVTIAAIAGPAVLLLVATPTGATLVDVGALAVPGAEGAWRYLTAPFAYIDVGYLFVVALGLAIFAPGLERRLGSLATALLLLACGALGALAAAAVADATGGSVVIAGGNGIALGALAAWFMLRRGEEERGPDDGYDAIGVAVAAAVLFALPLFESAADPFAGIAGAAVGAVAGLLAARLG